jgi:hypothetical protein
LKIEIYVLNIFKIYTKLSLLLNKRILDIEFIQGGLRNLRIGMQLDETSTDVVSNYLHYSRQKLVGTI